MSVLQVNQPIVRVPAKVVPLWDFHPCHAKRCVVIVQDDPTYPNYWARPYVGKARQAVEVISHGQRLYIDNEDGTGWIRVTENPNYNFREFKVQAVVGYLE